MDSNPQSDLVKGDKSVDLAEAKIPVGETETSNREESVQKKLPPRGGEVKREPDIPHQEKHKVQRSRKEKSKKEFEAHTQGNRDQVGPIEPSGRDQITHDTNAGEFNKTSKSDETPMSVPTGDIDSDKNQEGIDNKKTNQIKPSTDLNDNKHEETRPESRNKVGGRDRQTPSPTNEPDNGVQSTLEISEGTEDNQQPSAGRLRQSKRYRPPSKFPIKKSQSSERREKGRPRRQRTYELRVRLVFHRRGQLSFGLLPQRQSHFPEQIAVVAGGGTRIVSAISDGWYEDIYLDDLSAILADGVIWEGLAGTDPLGHWGLSGRDLFVLVSNNELRGFVQSTNLEIGKNHVVICRDSFLDKVELILKRAGCVDTTVLNQSNGVPRGWTVIRDVLPTRVVAGETDLRILSILQPKPELEIEFRDGIQLERGTWLQGFPPDIHIDGDNGPDIEVFVDGCKAHAGENGSVVYEGYDSVGSHIVSIPNASKSSRYVIKQGQEHWCRWDAHDLSQFKLCGPLVFSTHREAVPKAIVVPASNNVILGSKPGQISYCARIPGPKLVGCVTYDPVWAVPFNPYQCDRNSTTVRLLNNRPIETIPHGQIPGSAIKQSVRWATTILDATRKGLRVDECDPDASRLWVEYRTYARSLWKAFKK